ALVPNPTVAYNSPNSFGSLTVSLASAASGSATITVTVQDNGGTANNGQNAVTRMFTVNVAAGLPELEIVQWTGQGKLYWSVHAVGFVLESRDSLITTGGWSVVTEPPTVEGERFTVTLPDTGTAKYFRLRGP